jgi:hypothetical protein
LDYYFLRIKPIEDRLEIKSIRGNIGDTIAQLAWESNTYNIRHLVKRKEALDYIEQYKGSYFRNEDKTEQFEWLQKLLPGLK